MKQSEIIGYDFTLRRIDNCFGSVYVYDTTASAVHALCSRIVRDRLGNCPYRVTLRLRHRPFDGCHGGSCDKRELQGQLCHIYTEGEHHTFVIYASIKHSLQRMYPQMVGSKEQKSQKRFYWSIEEA